MDSPVGKLVSGKDVLWELSRLYTPGVCPLGGNSKLSSLHQGSTTLQIFQLTRGPAFLAGDSWPKVVKGSFTTLGWPCGTYNCIFIIVIRWRAIHWITWLWKAYHSVTFLAICANGYCCTYTLLPTCIGASKWTDVRYNVHVHRA